MAKKKKNYFGLLVLLFILIVFCIFLFKPGLYEDFIGIFNHQEEVINSDDLEIHFLELGTKSTGDSIYIKAGKTDILIDAGAIASSSKTICNYLSQYVTDEKLEYVIATHAHKDHISAFVGTKDSPGVFDQYQVDTLIDFPLTNSTAKIYQNYCTKRDILISQGTKHYNALECYQNKNGASRKYELSEGIELEILYNYYYEHQSSQENDYSVCLLINQGTKHFLFTGDLEAKGEEYLVSYNQLPEVEVYKAGHHGSSTSSTTTLLNVIKPKIVCVCCCAGSDEYTTEENNTFPTQEFISRIVNFTDQVYVTTVVDEDQKNFHSMNGNIVVSSKANMISVNCSNNNQILKDTDWFKKNRKWQ